MENEILTEEQAQELFNKVVSGEPIDNGTNSEKLESKEQIEETAPVATSTGEAIQADSQPVQTQPEAKEEKKDDPLAFVESLAPDIKERVFSLVQERDAALQRDARLRGQISALDRKNHQERLARAELEKKLASFSAQQTPQLDEIPPELQELAETDPNLAKALDAQAKLVEARLRAEYDQKLEATIKPIHEFREQEHQQEIVSQLDNTVPNWRQIVLDTDEHGNPVVDNQGQVRLSKYWQDFTSALPERLRDVALVPKSVEDAMWAFQEYDKWARQFYPAPAQSSAPNPADAIQAKREQDKKKTTVKTPTPPVQPVEEPDWSDEKTREFAFQEALKKITGQQSKLYR